MKDKLIKIKSFQSDTDVIYIKKDDVMYGKIFSWPVVGQSFYFGGIQTTEVLEIIDDRTFRTKNSIYKIITLEDERNDKIKIIVNE